VRGRCEQAPGPGRLDGLGATTSPNPVVPGFPHLAPAGHEDLPALADLLGLRKHTPRQPTS